MIRLALIRHGHTDWNRAGRIQGRTDRPLDGDARAQLAGLALPAQWADADLVASPLLRAMETGQIMTGHQPRSDAALIEMDWGVWEGQHGVDLRADPASGYKDMEHWGWSFQPPGGESLTDLRNRLVPWAEGLRQDTVAICHIGVMRVLLAHATGWDFTGTAPFQVKRNRLFIIGISGKTWEFEEVVRLPERATSCA